MHKDGRREQRPFSREGGALEVDLGGPAEAFDHLEVSWPSSRLRDVTLIDTPGIASLSTEVSERTSTLLSAEDDRPPVVDAVLYLFRHTPRQRRPVPRGVPRRRAGPRHPAQRRRGAVAARRDRVVPARRADGRRPRRRPLRTRLAHPPPLPAGAAGRRAARPGRDDAARGGVPGAGDDRRAARRRVQRAAAHRGPAAGRRHRRPADPARARRTSRTGWACSACGCR